MYPNYVYAPQRKDNRPPTAGEPSAGPVRTPSGRLSRAGRPAARRGRAFTSDELPAEAMIRMPGLNAQAQAQYGEEQTGYLSGSDAGRLTPSASASSSSTAALVSPPRRTLPSALANPYHLQLADQLPSPAGYQQPSTMDAWGDFANSALHWHPQSQQGSVPSTPNDYWQIQPPMSAPAAVANFSFDTAFGEVLQHQPPMSASTATTAEWGALSGQSGPSTAASSAVVQVGSGLGQEAGSPWAQGVVLPESSFGVEGYPTLPSGFDPVMMNQGGVGGYSPAIAGGAGDGVSAGVVVEGVPFQSFGGAVEYTHPMSSEIDAGVEWENHQRQLQQGAQYPVIGDVGTQPLSADHYAFPPAHHFSPR